MNMKTYLVTGGAGFIGSNFIIYMLEKYPEIKIINMDSLTYAGNLENLKSVEKNPNYKFFKGNIYNRGRVEEIFCENKIDCVINFAAESHVDRSIKDPEQFVKTNVLGTMTLLEQAKKSFEISDGVYREEARFIQVSTDEVYGSLEADGKFTETTPLDPHSPYSASKASADVFVRAYAATYGFPAIITRSSNNYGPYQFPEKLIPLMITNAFSHKELPVYGDGLQVRDWIYVLDNCKAIDMVINHGKLGEIYNIGAENEQTNLDVVNKIVQIIRDSKDNTISNELIKHVTDRKGHDRRYAIDPSKIMTELGWKPETSFEDGIRKTIDWYADNKLWIDRISTGDYAEYYEKMYL